MARKLSFVNYKGGVGKTSIVVNVASCLAYMGKRVLVVDFDPQSNSSIWLMRLDRWNSLNKSPQNSLFSIFRKNNDIRNVLIKDVIKDGNDEHLLPGLDLLPTTFNLMDLEHEYQDSPDHPCYVHFYEEIQKIEADYDYIFFDCPPNAFRSTQCALFASEQIYVPANPDALSLIGLSLIADKAHLFSQNNASFRDTYQRSAAKISGIILNAIKMNINIDVPIQRMQIRLDHFKQSGKAFDDAAILDNRIRDTILVRRVIVMGLPIILLENSDGVENIRDDYLKLSQTIDKAVTQQTATV